MYGWWGKILRIDLTVKSYSFETLSSDLREKFIGGKGLAGFYLKEKAHLTVDDPDMPLLLFTGPLVDTLSPTSGHMTIMSKSPLTGTIGDTSVGGTLAVSLKRTGVDGIIITGKSDDACGIEICNDLVRFTDAGEFKGYDNWQIYNALKEKGSVLSTGPAAENGVLFSNIAVEGSAMGRNGLGLSFAFKKLKYVTISGSHETKIFDLDGLLKAKEDIVRLTHASPVLMGELGISNYGTGALFDLIDNRRMMPTSNFRKTYFEEASLLNANAYIKKYDPKTTGCMGCHIQCKKIGADDIDLPGVDVMVHFSALLENSDIDTVKEANAICSRMGMDPISAAVTLAAYSEKQNKRLSPEKIVQLLIDIANARNAGAQLKEGVFRYAKANNCLEMAMCVKAQELPAYDPRGAYGMALAYVTSTRGGCHLNAYPISHEILRKPVVTNRFEFAGKARIIKISEDINAVVDSLTACKLIFLAASLEEYAKVYTAVTGVDSSAQDLVSVGERIYYNERIMNFKNGFSSKDDDLPVRFFKQPGSSGNGIDIAPLNREDFLKARSNYYMIRGLDEEGNPLDEKINELGLSK